jgi:hypothetical protein
LAYWQYWLGKNLVLRHWVAGASGIAECVEPRKAPSSLFQFSRMGAATGFFL